MDDQRPPNGGLHLAGPGDEVQTDGPMDWALKRLSEADALLDELELEPYQRAMLAAMTGTGWALAASLLPAPRWATPCLHPETKTMPVIEGSRVRNVTVCTSCGAEVHR